MRAFADRNRVSMFARSGPELHKADLGCSQTARPRLIEHVTPFWQFVRHQRRHVDTLIPEPPFEGFEVFLADELIRDHRQLSLPQSSSASRFTAGASGF